MALDTCKGCRNIDQDSFPFDHGYIGVPQIDTEGCGDYDEEHGALLIYYCPVCGEKLIPREPREDA